MADNILAPTKTEGKTVAMAQARSDKPERQSITATPSDLVLRIQDIKQTPFTVFDDFLKKNNPRIKRL